MNSAECPIARSLDAIGDWWSLLIIRDALLGIRRFGEFQKSLGLAKNILTVRLRALVDHGILKTAPASDGSAYQEYVLTPKGRGVFPVLVALRQWSEEFDVAPGACATMLVDREKGRPVRKLELRSQDGRLLGAGDTEAEGQIPSQTPPAPLGLNDVAAGAKIRPEPARALRELAACCEAGRVPRLPVAPSSRDGRASRADGAAPAGPGRRRFPR